ncbi:hypothetical protein LCGC14_0763800, partial [marine sediment metagenome]
RQDIIEEVEVYCPHCGWQLEERIWRHGQDREIIWKKPNPMPESVTDRCTKSHEYIFLLTKSAKYFYDAEAIKEKMSPNTHSRGKNGKPAMTMQKTAKAGSGIKNNDSFQAAMCDLPPGTKRNKRSVWNVATHPFPEAHFATFPPKLIEPCILAGTSEKGCCVECGSPWVRKNEYCSSVPLLQLDKVEPPIIESKTIGWEPTCSHTGFGGPEYKGVKQKPCTVLDPFGGSMTTAIVAYKHNRKFIMIELSEAYINDIGIPRIEKEIKQLKLWK